MTEYQVFARKYRPQTFTEVLGQAPVVTTLKNAILFNRTAHAYLFCGARGTGKTTLARLFAKALNCPNRSDMCEPCNACSSCQEIALGRSLDVLEIDGASHRGIDDIRQINETVGYAPPTGTYKIYIIDEVHMLTKEAFNALLKTLEEPPEKVKFFFATTEPHKVLSTVLSRCQRFNLNRISTEVIVDKLTYIVKDHQIEVEQTALALIAKRAQGGLRDAEFLLDQVLAFHQGPLTANHVADLLGLPTSDFFFRLDEAGKTGNFAIAYEVSHEVYTSGKELPHFLECYTEHFRNLLIVKTCDQPALFLGTHGDLLDLYTQSAALYRKEQLVELIAYLIEQSQKIRTASSPQIFLENTLLHILRTHYQIPIESIVERLVQLESKTPHPLREQAPPKITSSTSPKSSRDKEPPTPQIPPKKSPAPLTNSPPRPSSPVEGKTQAHLDTLMQFAGVEFEGHVEKH